MSHWSLERIAALAPDAGVMRTASDLARSGHWQTLGHDEQGLWGEYRGSGSKPYAVRIALLDAAYACSCPSRKQPCKHVLGLLIKLVEDSVASAAPPDFMQSWLAERERRAKPEDEKREPAATPVVINTAARQQRVAKREQRISTGLMQLETWLGDIMSEGLAATRQHSAGFWSQMAARLVDAQAPGLARRVSELYDIAVTSPQWQTDLLAGLARLQLLIDAYRRRDALPHDLAAEVRTLVGWTQDQDALREREGIRDLWQVVGRRQSDTEQVRTQFTWLHGEHTGQLALLLQFAIGNQPLAATHLVGQVLDAELVFFDGCPRLRALEKARHATQAARGTLPAVKTIAALQADYAHGLAQNPWLERYPVLVGPVRPILFAGQVHLEDAERRRIPFGSDFHHSWNLLALAGAAPVNVFGEWNGISLLPLSVERAGELFTFSRLGDLATLARAA